MFSFINQKRGDLAIVSSFAYQFFAAISRLPRNQAIADFKIVSLVNSLGTWTEAQSRHKDKLENPGLVQQEAIKNRKHAPFYSPIGFAFFPLVASCFCSLGPIAVWCLYSLADLELHQHDSLRSRQGLPPLADPSARAQFRALCYRRMSARIGHAVAKASVMRLLAVPRLPVPAPVPRALLARNCPGPADSFLFSPPSSYRDSLLSSLTSCSLPSSQLSLD